MWLGDDGREVGKSKKTEIDWVSILRGAGEVGWDERKLGREQSTKEGVMEERLRRIKKLARILSLVRQRDYAWKPNGRGKEERILWKERCLWAGSSLGGRTGWIEGQTGIVNNMKQETGIVTPWEAERLSREPNMLNMQMERIKAGWRYWKWGNNLGCWDGRVEGLQWWTKLKGKHRAKGIRKQKLGWET